jgi:hypothetical protein
MDTDILRKGQPVSLKDICGHPCASAANEFPVMPPDTRFPTRQTTDS